MRAERATARRPPPARAVPGGDKVTAGTVRAPVAAPLDWPEVSASGLRPEAFTLRTMAARLDRSQEGGDPWARLARRRYSLAKARERLVRLKYREK